MFASWNGDGPGSCEATGAPWPHTCAGNSGLAHVRYPTAGGASAKEAQPFFVNSPLGMFLIHNGNLTNALALRKGLQSSSSFFNRMLRTNSDSEVLLNVFADEIHRAHQRCVNENPQLDPNDRKMQFVQEAGQEMMQVLLLTSTGRCSGSIFPYLCACHVSLVYVFTRRVGCKACSDFAHVRHCGYDSAPVGSRQCFGSTSCSVTACFSVILWFFGQVILAC